MPCDFLRIYFFGCLGVYIGRFFRCLCCGVCICCNCTYKDKAFPANASSIGKWKDKSPAQIQQEVECWLMSAIACLAHQEGAIQRVFKTDEYSNYGKYKVKIFDSLRKKFVTVVIDDWIPCNKATGQTCFAKPNGDEAWVLLLEKAMAKFKGSYGALDGGSTLWALEALTGDYCFKFKQETKGQKPVWKRYDIVYTAKGQGDVMLQPTSDELSHEDMFQTMLFYNRKRSVIAASTGSGNDTQNINGIVQGHAYSIIAVKEVDNFKMVQLRNPWGTFEWKGNWSDSSPLWRQHPKLAKALNFVSSEDGTFWMEFKDFLYYYKNLDFCYRTTGWDDLALDIHEECPCCGPTWGCISGCVSFWCCCKGCRALCCTQQRTTYQHAEKGCCATC